MADLTGLMNISLSDSEGDDNNTDTNKNNTDSPRDRTALSETDFQSLKAAYKAKTENGDIWKKIKLPLPHVTGLNKPEIQELLHAVEELYFFRRYDEAIKLIHGLLTPECPLDEETQQLLRHYELKASQKLQNTNKHI
ncbi:hypothetical protein QBC46DRAFT_380498 [Diplogelasinospora grovesii]|uniref:Uncharacterized protein n=1 Tax=Diplogelasinospora grovesii TaxID=303347 RepID=A0AAN6NDN6_9PEZI|nr:hypothetical protein QBC46DRAFT_380498 [Diplogelasinospora grovesii]